MVRHAAPHRDHDLLGKHEAISKKPGADCREGGCRSPRSVKSTAVPLTAALGGYRHQDLMTACAYASLMAQASNVVEVGAELAAAERYHLDDLGLRGDSWLGVQLKSSTSTGALRLRHLTTNKIKFRLDEVIAAYWAAPDRPDECRLVVTHGGVDDDLAVLVEAAGHGPLIPGFTTQRYVLVPESWWPAEGEPIFAGLTNVTRDEFVQFCERFVLEVGCPPQSGDLSNPGPLEQALFAILHEKVGVGRFPNAGRDPRDVAKALTDLARVSRDRWLTRQDVLEQLGLRDDFGQARQDLKIDKTTQVQLSTEVDALKALMGQHPRIAVTGQPGAGKSWRMHALRERLIADGWIVASHYLYIGSADVEQSSRISAEVMFGSLIAQLRDAVPTAGIEANAPRLSAGPHELEEVLKALRAQPSPRPIAIIIDGLDHADRVTGRRQPGATVELTAQLCLMDLPEGVTLLAASQPGVHMTAFGTTALEYEVEGWPERAVVELASQLGVGAALDPLMPSAEQEKITEIICTKAAGTPLVATYLCRTTIALATGTIAPTSDPDIATYLAGAPRFDGQIEAYYRWLLDGLNDDGARLCARAVAVSGFAVTPADLAEIHPLIAGQADSIIRQLSPVLSRDAITGAVRISHESFQRFVRDETRDSLPTLLSPVISWLGSKDFFGDARAFRHQLPMLYDAGRQREVLDLVGVDFVALAAASSQPWDAVAGNLEVAARSAAELRTWPKLAFLLELARSAEFFYTWRLDGDDRTAGYGRAHMRRCSARPPWPNI